MSSSDAMKNVTEQSVDANAEAVGRGLPAAAKRALAEAEARRAARDAAEAAAPREVGGPTGLDPARYGDWEKGGIVSDF